MFVNRPSDISKPIKITLIGDGSTGKSSYYNKLISLDNPDYRFNKKYKATDNFNVKKLNIPTNIGDINIFLWDTAGQEKYGGDLRDAYIKGSDGMIILYDVCDRNSINNLPKWISDTSMMCNNIPIAVCGNKVDRLDNYDNLETIKMRQSKLRTMYSNGEINGFLLSIKENINVVDDPGSLFKKVSVRRQNGVLTPLEYILSRHYNKNVHILDIEPKPNADDNDF